MCSIAPFDKEAWRKSYDEKPWLEMQKGNEDWKRAKQIQQFVKIRRAELVRQKQEAEEKKTQDQIKIKSRIKRMEIKTMIQISTRKEGVDTKLYSKMPKSTHGLINEVTYHAKVVTRQVKVMKYRSNLVWNDMQRNISYIIPSFSLKPETKQNPHYGERRFE